MYIKYFLFLITFSASLWAGGQKSDYGTPQEALSYYKKGGTVTVFPPENAMMYSYQGNKFPTELLQIPTLKKLSIINFNFQVPESIIKLQNLEELGIDGYGGGLILPKNIAKLPKLRVLRLSDLHNIQNLEAICKYTQITELFLAHNQWTKLPECIGDLTKLKILELRANKFKKLPKSIGQLMNLEKLNLSENQLESLPESIINLVNMEYLEAAKNKFKIEHVQLHYLRNEFNYKQMWESKYWQKIYKAVFRAPYPAIPEAYNVTASSGLSVRKEPSLKAQKIGSMPYRLKIAVYEESKNTESIDGITAPWMRIKAVANGKYMEGWAWAGYLEKYSKEKDYSLQFKKMLNELTTQKTKPILDRERIQFYIQNGGDIDTKDFENRWRLLSFVAHAGTIEDFRFLLANGASVQAKDKYGNFVGSSVISRDDIEFKSKKAFLLALQDYGYDFKWEGRALLYTVLYSVPKNYREFIEENIDSEMLDFLKEQLNIKSVTEILSDADIYHLFYY